MQFSALVGTPLLCKPQDALWPGASWNDPDELRTAVPPQEQAICADVLVFWTWTHRLAVDAARQEPEAAATVQPAIVNALRVGGPTENIVPVPGATQIGLEAEGVAPLTPVMLTLLAPPAPPPPGSVPAALEMAAI